MKKPTPRTLRGVFLFLVSTELILLWLFHVVDDHDRDWIGFAVVLKLDGSLR